MLKGIPSILSPDLLKTLMEMGHGDELVLADGNYPAAADARRLIRADGHPIPELLDSILRFFPLDRYVKEPVLFMDVADGDPVKPVIWNEYRRILAERAPGFGEIALLERFAFYERAKKAFAIVATGEQAIYANIILKKGVVV